jgi:cytochrome c peroxidase
LRDLARLWDVRDRDVLDVRTIACVIALAVLAACHGGAAPATPPPAADSDPAPVLTAADKAAFASLSPASLPAPAPDATNRYADDAAAAALGQKLFMDPGFSGRLLDGDNDGSAGTLGVKGDTGKVSCASCHNPQGGFSDTRIVSEQRSISLAAGWNLRHTPSLLDVGQAKLLMWDGRRDALFNQPFGPLENPNEMNSSRLYVAEQIAARYAAAYQAIFGPLPDLSSLPQVTAAQTGCDRPVQGTPTCHGKPGDGAEYDSLTPAQQDAVTRIVVNVGKALGAYERRLSCGQGAFDAWVAGNDAALSHSAQRGAQLFVGKAQCINCHSGPYLTDQKFHGVGLRPATVAVAFIDLDDHGAWPGLTAAIADPLNSKGAYSDGDDGRLTPPDQTATDGAFRTPGLRCVSGRPSFMHTGQLTNLASVVSFFSAGGQIGGYPGHNELSALNLSAQEQADLVAFLQSLQGPGPATSLLQ